MKAFYHAIKMTGAMLCVLFLFSQCAKQVNEQSFTPNQSCRPVLLAFAGEGGGWVTEMQKWYGSDGKVAYLKANLLFATEPMLPYGEVTYHNNNQVYVRNMLFGDTLIRVTLDALQRPAASYFLYPRTQRPIRDTSYYYFTGKRLDSILSLFGPFFDIGGITFRKIIFSYDAYGNVVRIGERYNNLPTDDKWLLTYDYTKPVADMLPSYTIDRPYSLLSYLDLLHFPVHHQLVSVSRSLLGLTFYYNYSDYQLLGNGLVQSYKRTYIFGSPFPPSTYYTDWDCSSTTPNLSY